MSEAAPSKTKDNPFIRLSSLQRQSKTIRVKKKKGHKKKKKKKKKNSRVNDPDK